jgi:hypothetical protein
MVQRLSDGGMKTPLPILAEHLGFTDFEDVGVYTMNVILRSIMELR